METSDIVKISLIEKLWVKLMSVQPFLAWEIILKGDFLDLINPEKSSHSEKISHPEKLYLNNENFNYFTLWKILCWFNFWVGHLNVKDLAERINFTQISHNEKSSQIVGNDQHFTLWINHLNHKHCPWFLISRNQHKIQVSS